MPDNASNWYRLDNAGKIFPEVYSEKNSNTFRIQIALTEIIDPEILQQATNNILERFPMFKVRLKRGLFWTYLEENDKEFYIKEMPFKLCAYVDFAKNNDYLFNVFYRNKLIAVEVFHTLTDGTGLVEFVKSLAYEYLVLKGYDLSPDNIIRTTKERPLKDEHEDSAMLYYDKKNKKSVKEPKAFRITGTQTPNYMLKLLSGLFVTSEVLNLAKSNGATVTEYITAVMAYSIYRTKIKYRTSVKGHSNPIKIGVPVNLRTRFPSQTMRNFVNIVSCTINVPDDNVTFEEILAQVQQQLKEKTTKNELTRIMSEYVKFEKNIFMRIVPSIIKKYVMKIGYSLIGSNLFTLSLSNIGRVTFPESMDPYLDNITFMVSASPKNNINCAIISYKEKFKISFTSNILESNIQREFIRHFTELGLNVEVESNYLEEVYEGMQ